MKILDYIFAARPLLHLPIWSIYLVSLHFHLKLSGESFALSDFFILIALTMAASASYFINQIYDYESDLINNKVGFLQQNIISEKSMMRCYLISSALSIMIGFALSHTAGFIILIINIVGYIYSAPPFRLKDRPFSGLLANAFGIGFLVPILVMPDISMHNSGLLGWDNPFYFAFTVGAIFILTTIPDKRGDEKVGKKTLAVLLSKPILKILALILISDSIGIAFYSDYLLLVYLSSICLLPIILSLVVTSEKLDLFAIKLPILLLTVLASYFHIGYFVFIVALIVLTRIYYKKRFKMVYPKLT